MVKVKSPKKKKEIKVFGIAKKKAAVIAAPTVASPADFELHKKVIVKTGQPIAALQGEDAAGAGVERVSVKRNKFLAKKNAKKERQGKQLKAKPANKIAAAQAKAAAAAASSPMDDLTSFASALAGVDTRGSAAVPVKQTNKRRSKNMVCEVDRFQAVLQHPAFKANPFATAFEHLENSITSMHVKAAAKAEEKEIRSQSKALKERTEGKPVPVKGSVKSSKQQRKQTENARQMSGAFFAAKRKARESRDRDRKSSGGGGGKSFNRPVKGGIGKKAAGGGVKPQHSGGRRGLK